LLVATIETRISSAGIKRVRKAEFISRRKL